jgi:anti-sigma regulatory factor (Ser/Thr protein kinase)
MSIHTRAVGDDLHDVARAVEWVGGLAAEAGLPEDLRFSIELCLEEALANLVMHASAPSGEKDARIAVTVGADDCTIRLSDRCAPFDVVGAPLPDTETPAELKEGGRGLRLLRAFASELAYDSEPGRNILTLTFRRAPPTEAPAA